MYAADAIAYAHRTEKKDHTVDTSFATHVFIHNALANRLICIGFLPCHSANHALTLKGLRQNFFSKLFVNLLRQPCPDSKGIETT